MIRRCTEGDFEAIYEIINDAAQAYKGIIPADRWREPYMPRDELKDEIEQGVVFWGCEEEESLVGVMGIQDVDDVTLIRHAYVRTSERRKGIGEKLLTHLRGLADKPLLIGTWADARWAIAFYEKHGFQLVSPEEKERLLRRYWTIPKRQIETSVVLQEKTYIRREGIILGNTHGIPKKYLGNSIHAHHYMHEFIGCPAGRAGDALRRQPRAR